MTSGWFSEIHPIGPLQPEDLARVVGRRDLEAQALDDLPHLADLLGIRGRELAGPDPYRILEADAHVAAHRGRHGGDRHLIATGAEHRPAIVLAAEQAVGG